MLPLVLFTSLLAADYKAFHAQREKEINSEYGWTSLVGLHWLKQGENRIGSDPSSDVPLPEGAPKRVGIISLEGKQAFFSPGPEINVKRRQLRPDVDVIQLGRIKFFLIERDGKFAVRVKDPDAPRRKSFSGLKWYPADAGWRITAKFTPFAERHTIVFDTMAGVKEQMESPGYATFSKDGREFRLDPVWEGDRLFFVFRDQTSGKSTYGGARFLYAKRPQNGAILLDFNESVNPPCVFTPYATCPLPPPQNRLAIEVKAGELMYGQNNHVFP